MNIADLRKMVSKQWVKEFQYLSDPPTPEVRFITGNYETDTHLHHLRTVYGLDLSLTQDLKGIKDYEVVDEQKFLMFVLRWS